MIKPRSRPRFAKEYNPDAVPPPHPARGSKPKTSWGGVANWYDNLLHQEGTFQKEVILPNLTRLMHIRRGEKLIDIACGSGFFSRAFEHLGAEVVGADISKELVDIARKESSPRIAYKVAPAEKLGFIADKSFDKAVIILAIQNIEHYQKALKEASRVLKSGGKLYLVLNHPTFRIPRASGWKFTEEAQVRFVEKYLSEFSISMRMHNQQTKGEETISYHRPLTSYVKALFTAGLAVTNLEEWISPKVSDSGPRAVAENNARKEIPLFMLIEATKY